jgi:hypothetical protein
MKNGQYLGMDQYWHHDGIKDSVQQWKNHQKNGIYIHLLYF